MKRIWRRKWLVMAATIAVFLSVGAAAWAATTGGSDSDETARNGMVCKEAACRAAAGDEGGKAGAMGMMGRRAMERAEGGSSRMEQLEQLREKMTTQDQAQYDELLAKAKEQRDQLKQARQDLRDTLKQLRDLAKKYLDGRTDTTG